MRPLRLEIEGLTSFRERQEIDFSGLDLFVITGPTGAGKTTILDAITFALYGEIPRTGKRNASDLVTHGDTRARVLLEFCADSKTYRVSRVLPRNGAQKALLERRDGNNWRPDVEESGVKPVNARIESIIGLDFDGFTRAVLLPQGEFAQFLSGEAKQRRDILMRLLELGRYEKAGQFARQEADRLNSDICAKEQVLAEEYAEATEETVSAAVETATGTRASAEFKSKAGEKVEQIASRLINLLNQLTSIERDETVLGGVEKSLGMVAKGWADVQPQKAEAEAALLRASTRLGEARVVQRKAATDLERVRECTGDEGLLAALDAACASLMRETTTLVELKQAIAIAEQDIGRLGRALAAASGELENAKARQVSAKAAEESWRAEAQRIAQSVRRAEGRAEAERKVSALTAESHRWHGELEARRAVLKQLESAMHAAEERLSCLQNEHTGMGLRAKLVVGKPCPVCLQQVRKAPASGSEVTASMRAADNDLRAAKQRLRKAEDAVSEANSEGRLAERSLEEATRTVARLADAPLLAEAIAEAAALEEKHAQVSGDQEMVTRLVNEKTEAYGQLATRLAAAKATREGRTREHAAAESRRHGAERELKAGFPAGLPEHPQAAIVERRRELQAARETEATARNNFDRAREVHEEVTATCTGVERRATELMQRCAERRGVLRQLSKNLGIKPAANMKTPRQAVGDEFAVLGEWREMIAAELGRLRKVTEKEQKRETGALSGVLTSMGVSPASAELARIQATVRSAVREASHAATRAAENATGLRRKLARRRELETQITAARKREHLYHALADELRQNRFIEYLLGESISRLATLASAELSGISGGRYGLIAEQSGFVVVDHANADETRSVDTLSGGETFLASLSLATALARSITDIAGQAIGSRLEAMFIDEGFGALDTETLDAAIDALERLRDSERLVGVITHVSQLAERIPDGLMVEREGATSRVRPR